MEQQKFTNFKICKIKMRYGLTNKTDRQTNKHAMLGLSTNLDLIKYLVFKMIKGITGN